MNILVTHFGSRKELDMHVRGLVGDSNEPNTEHLIVGTKEELERFHLRQGQRVFGVLVDATDFTTPDPIPEIDRGMKYDTKINGVTVKHKKKHGATNKS